MSRRTFRTALTTALLGAGSAGADQPLHIDNPASRTVFVQAEVSNDLATIGQTFGTQVTGTYSASGGVGTLVIPADQHALLRPNSFPPVVPEFTSLVIQIDLATHRATTQTASGGYQSGPITEGFTQGALDSDATQGFVGPGTPPLACSSQAYVDFLCTIVPSYCGKTCTLVPGSDYDVQTGKVNMVGIDNVSGCDGPSMCSGPFQYYAPYGDMRLSEPVLPAPVPALSPVGTALLLAALAVAARSVRRR